MEVTHYKKLLNVTDAAEFLSISPRTIYNRIARKSKNRFPVKPIRIGRSVRFDIDDLKKYIESLKSDKEI